MRFGLVHRLMTDALATLGVFALVASGKLHPFAVALVVLGLAASFLLPERIKQGRTMRLLGAFLPPTFLALQLLRLFLGAAPIPIVVEFAALLQVVRLATRRGAAHDHQVILLALLHLIAGTVLGGGLTYAAALVGFLILTPGALVLSHLRREVEGNYRQGARDRTGMPVDVPRILRSRRVIDSRFLLFTCSLALPVFLTTALLFLAFPRVGFAWLVVSPVEPSRVVGFSDRVDLGGVGTIRSDPALVMRVIPGVVPENPPHRKNLYLRGAAFDRYDGHAWERSARIPHHREMGTPLVALTRYPRTSDEVWKVDLEPIQPPVVFLPGDAVAFELIEENRRPGRARALIQIGMHGEIEYVSAGPGGISYQVFLPPRGTARAGSELSEALENSYLQLPTDLPQRVRELGRKWTEGETDPAAQALKIQERLRRGYRYDLNSPSGGTADPLDHFLFESKAGHCEFYSTAMVILLRTLGVPARNVTGFVGGTYNRFGGFYAVRQGDAHSWVEAFFPELGWKRFDPTPPSQAEALERRDSTWLTMRELVEALAQTWDQHVVGFDLNHQMGLLGTVRKELSRGRDFAKSLVPSRSRVEVFLLLGLALLAASGLYWAWRRRVARPRAEERELSSLRTIDLYRRLERVLDHLGLSRPLATPPLRHAEAISGAGHPLGGEIVALTSLYVRARFGGEPLSRHEEEDFLGRVSALRVPPVNQKGGGESRASAS